MISKSSIAQFQNQVDWNAWEGRCDRLVHDESGPWLIACSGGADSVFLALALHVRFAEQRPCFRLLHFNHGLRGEESDGDEQFCEALAGNLGFEFLSERFEVSSSEVNEQALRELRLAAMERWVETTGASGLFLGHHGTDAVEWGLMRLLRGASPQALSSPKAIRRHASNHYLVRPLLGYSRDDIRWILNECGIQWREDSSNKTGDFTRNRLRREILPQLREVIPHDLEKGYARTQILMREVDEALEVLLDQLAFDIAVANRVDGNRLVGQGMAIWRRAFFRWANKHQSALTDLKATAIDEMLLTWSTGGKSELSFRDGTGGLRRLIIEDYVLIVADPAKTEWWTGRVKIVPGISYYFPNGEILRGDWVEGAELVAFKSNPQKADPETTAWLDAECLGDDLYITTWQSGDRYRPLGAPGSKKLQDWFVDRKIPEELRRELPVCRQEDGEVFWVPFFAPAEAFKISNSTEKALRLTYRLL